MLTIKQHVPNQTYKVTDLMIILEYQYKYDLLVLKEILEGMMRKEENRPQGRRKVLVGSFDISTKVATYH